MSEDEDKRAVQRAYLDGMNGKDPAVIEECFAADYVCHFPGGSGRGQGHRELQGHALRFPQRL